MTVKHHKKIYGIFCHEKVILIFMEKKIKTNNIKNFFYKVVIIIGAIIFILNYLTPKNIESDKNKLYLISLIQNPRILWELSLIEEEKNNLHKAKRYMKAAIGLIEMNQSNETI